MAQEVSKPTALDAKLPVAMLGGRCGAGTAICMHGCCSQQGFCGECVCVCEGERESFSPLFFAAAAASPGLLFSADRFLLPLLPPSCFSSLSSSSPAQKKKRQETPPPSSTGLSPGDCDALCQVLYSAPNALCRGKARLETPNPDTLPLVGTGEVCGAYVARCERGCCNELNYCEEEIEAATNEPSHACAQASCVLPGSPNSKACADAHKRIKAVTRRYKIVAEWGKMAPDGFGMRVILLNGAYPGPTIFANVGDRIVVEFHNRLARPVTVHWHGMKQVNTNMMDGVGDVTQAAIEGSNGTAVSGNSSNGTQSIFVYDFIANVAGSFW